MIKKEDYEMSMNLNLSQAQMKICESHSIKKKQILSTYEKESWNLHLQNLVQGIAATNKVMPLSAIVWVMNGMQM
jgi:peroxiredoxin